MESNRSLLVQTHLVSALAVALVLGLATESIAATIGLGDFSGSETLIDFTGLDVPPTPDPITVGDLTMDSLIADLVIFPTDIFGVWPETPLASGGAYLSNRRQRDTNMVLQFANPVKRVGMWINGGNTDTNWTFSAFDAAGNLVGSHIFVFNVVDGFPDPSTFAGMEFPTSFTKVTIVETIHNTQFTSIDDIRFEAVPEPSTALLLAAGLVGLAVNSRRSGKRAATPRRRPPGPGTSPR